MKRKCSHVSADIEKGPYCPKCGMRIFEEGWQGEDRTYTPAEQQLDMRIDGTTMRG